MDNTKPQPVPQPQPIPIQAVLALLGQKELELAFAREELGRLAAEVEAMRAQIEKLTPPPTPTPPPPKE